MKRSSVNLNLLVRLKRAFTRFPHLGGGICNSRDGRVGRAFTDRHAPQFPPLRWIPR